MEAFLHAPETDLDQGYSSGLRRRALAQGSLADAITYLDSASVQQELKGLFMGACGHSLDVERKHHLDKSGGETCKMTTVARASRNSILLRYRMHRRE